MMTSNLTLRTERHRIDVELGAVHSEVDALKHLPAETADEVDASFPAILDGAFKGGF